MTTINALKNLYVELGGNLEDVENITIIPEMINALSEIAGSTIELPAVSSTDNGDVLTVVSGKWAKAVLPSPEPELPEVTAADNGKVLAVVNGAWAESKESVLVYKATTTGDFSESGTATFDTEIGNIFGEILSQRKPAMLYVYNNTSDAAKVFYVNNINTLSIKFVCREIVAGTPTTLTEYSLTLSASTETTAAFTKTDYTLS